MTITITEMPIRLANTPSFDDGDGSDADVVVQTKPKTKRPPLYKVLLLNDDYTPMEFVVHVLEKEMLHFEDAGSDDDIRDKLKGYM